MLDTMRRGANSWIAKALFLLLVGAFAVWGIPHDFLSSRGAYLAKVGSTTISPDDFQQAFRNELNQLSQQFGRRITPEQARAFGLETQVLQRLIGTAAFDAHAHELGLNLSDDALIEDLKRDHGLQGPDGKFSRAIFESALREMQLSERRFIFLKRQDDLRRMLTSSLTGAIMAPQPTVDLLHAYRQETRTVEHFTIDGEKSIKVPEPDAAKLKDAYEKGKSAFMTPEYRTLAVLVLSTDALKSRIPVTDDEIKAAYEAEKDRYETPERRRIQQIAFKDKAAAEKAKADIAAGKSFADVATEAGAKATDIDLGILTRKQLIDPKIAEAAFSIQKDVVSGVVEGRFTTVLLRVTEIQPGKQPKLDEVKDQVRDKVFKEKASTEIQKIHDAVEDFRAAQKPLKDAAEAQKLPYFDIAAVDRQGKTPDGKTAISASGAEAIVTAGFEGDPGVEREAVELPDGGYAWVDVKGVTPPKQRPYEAVENDVKATVIAEERQRLLADLAARMVERADKGEAMATLAAEAGGKLDTASSITRQVTPQGLDQSAITLAFGLAKDKAGTTDTADKGSRVVLKVTEVKAAPPPTMEQSERIAGELKQQLENDIIGTYVAALEQRLGTTVNDAVLKRVLGSERQ